MAARDGGCGFLIIDADQWNKARAELREGGMVGFQTVSALINLYLNRRKAGSLSELGTRCGMPPGALETTVEKYNTDARNGGFDPLGKSADLTEPLGTPPFYAIDCCLGSALFPTPCITLGGLRVEGETGRVLHADVSAIEGLYAAGRNAGRTAARSGSIVSTLPIRFAPPATRYDTAREHSGSLRRATACASAAMSNRNAGHSR
jgi:3-oxo-5alpha-steroid 4-dehydrogenase